MANYIKNTKEILEDNNFSKDTNILDLTGRSPGFIYAFGGKSIGAGWVIGKAEEPVKYLDILFLLFLANS